MRSLCRCGLVFVLAALLAACAGTNFVKLSDQQIRLGADTEISLRQRLGTPYQEGAITKHDRRFVTIAYAYSAATGKGTASGVTPGRAQTFYLHDGKVVGHEFSSSWAEDSTDFEDWKVSQIKTNQTTLAEVVQLLGRPGGAFVYPLTEHAGERAAVYKYNQVTGSTFPLKIFAKSLIVTYNEAEVVTDVEFTQSGQY